jgi:hypothetical protein
MFTRITGVYTLSCLLRLTQGTGMPLGRSCLTNALARSVPLTKVFPVTYGLLYSPSEEESAPGGLRALA